MPKTTGGRKLSGSRRVTAQELAFLDHTVPQFFSSHRYMAILKKKLWERGIRRVGQLVELTEEEIHSIAPRVSPSVLDDVRKTLAQVDLALGMDTHGWKNPDDATHGSPPDRPKRAAAARSMKDMVRRRDRSTLG